MTAVNPSWLEPAATPSGAPPQQPQWLKTPEPEKPPQWLKPPQAPQPQQQQNQDPAGFRKWLTNGSIYGQNPSVNVMGDFSTDWKGFGLGGVRPQFRAIVQQLVGFGNKLGVYDFNKGHHYAANDPHLDGRAMDVDTVNNEPVGTRLSPNLGTFINQALQSDPRVRLGVPQEIYNQLGKITGNGRIFVDAPAHIHVEFDPSQGTLGKVPGTVKPDWLSTKQLPAQAKPVAQQPTPHLGGLNEAGIANAVAGASRDIIETGKGFFKEFYHEQTHPVDSFVDALGGLQRGVAGYLSQTDPTGKSWVTPPTPQALGMAIYDAFHPHSQEVANRDAQASIRSVFAPLNIPEAQKGTWAYYGQLIAAQTATDPTNLIPMVGPLLHSATAASVISRIAEAADAVPEIQGLLHAKQAFLGKLANNAVTEGVNWLFGSRPELRKFLDNDAYGARIVIEQGAGREMGHVATADKELLSQHEQILRNLQPDENGVYHLPEAVQQRYLSEPYIWGNQEMRDDAVRLGFKPTPEQASKPPMDLLHYNVRDDYQTLIKPPQETVNDTLGRVSGGAYKETPAGFEMSRKDDQTLGDDQYAVTENRLRLGRNVVRDRLIDQRTQQYLDAHGGWTPNGQQLAFKAVDEAYKAKHGKPAPSIDPVRGIPNRPFDVHWAPGKFMKQLAGESIKMFPFPHEIGNVGPLTFAGGGGWTAIGLALKHMVTGLSKEQMARMDAFGLMPEYMGRDMNAPWAKVPIGGKTLDWAINTSSKILNRMEGGFRQALLDLADHQHGYDPNDLKNEYKKAKDVLDATGDYENTSKIVKVLGGIIGGPFAAFGLSVVPKAILKALRYHPEKILGMARAQTQLSSDKGGPLPPGQELGGGVLESFGKMVTNFPGWLSSPSRSGLPGAAYQVIDRTAHGQPVDPAQLGGEVLQYYGGAPGNLISGAFGLAYPGPGQKRGQLNLRNALFEWLTGKYLKNEPSEKAEQYYDRTEEEGQYPRRIHHRHFRP